MDLFATQCQAQLLPPPVSRPPVQAASLTLPVADPQMGWFQHLGLASYPITTPYGNHPYCHPPPHLFAVSPFLTPYPANPYLQTPLPPVSMMVPPKAIALLTGHPEGSPLSSVSPPPPSVTAVSAVFSEYQHLHEPHYYDLLSGAFQDLDEAGFCTWDDEEIPSQPSVLAIKFLLSGARGSCLVITLTLWVGKRAVGARALINSGSKGDFVDSTFAATHLLGLVKR